MRGTTNSSYKTQKLSSIRIIDDSYDGNVVMMQGGTYQVRWVVEPEEASQAVTFSLDLEHISIDANGLITADDSFSNNDVETATLTLSLASNPNIKAVAPYVIRRCPQPTEMSVYGVTDMTVNRSGFRMSIMSTPSGAPTNSDIVLSDNTMATITSIEPSGYTDRVVVAEYKTLNKIGTFTATATNKFHPISATSNTLYVHPEPTGVYFEVPSFAIVINDGIRIPTPICRVQPFVGEAGSYNNAIQNITSETLTPDILEFGDAAVGSAFYAKALGRGIIQYTSVENTSMKNTVTVDVVPLTSFEVYSASYRNESTEPDEYIYKMTSTESFPLSIKVFEVDINESLVINKSTRLCSITTNNSKIYALDNIEYKMAITDYIQNEVVRVAYRDNPSYYGEVKVTVLPYS